MKTIIQKLWTIMALLCASSYASAYDFVSEGIAYTVTSFTDLECCVSKADFSYEGDIVIPNEVNYKGKTLTVTEIGDDAFYNSTVTSVILPPSLCKIGDGAFCSCDSLRTISLNEGLETIGESCFAVCTSIETVVLPNTLTNLGRYAFQSCTNLREVDLSGLSALRLGTFGGCVNLNLITGDNNLQSIGDEAFRNCGFESFQIPNSVTYIGKEILYGNQKLQRFTIGNGLNSIPGNPIKGCPNIKELIIADGDNSLELNFYGSYNTTESPDYSYYEGAFADVNVEYVYIGRPIEVYVYRHLNVLPPFHGNKSIKRVEFSSNVHDVYSVSISHQDYGYFEGCTNLEELLMPDVTEIGSYFARNATSLKSIDISNCSFISSEAFSGCSSLETVILGSKIEGIATAAFEGCNSITSIYCKANTPPRVYSDFPRDLYFNCNLFIPSGTEEAYKRASPWNNFWNMSESSECVSTFTCNNIIYSVTSGDNVTIIGNNISELCDLTIPNQIEYYSKKYNVIGISENAFRYARKLLGITIPENITYISNDAFKDCEALNTITFEYSNKPLQIGYNSKLNLSNVIIPFPNPSDVDEKRTGFRNGYYDGLFYGLPIKHLVINRDIKLPKYYERVGGGSSYSYEHVYNDIIYYPPFYGLSNLKSVEIGENVSAICRNQIEAVVNAIPTTMGYTNFGKCDNIEVVISHNPSAPIGGGFSQNVYDKATLFIPNTGEMSYNSDDYWKQFASISTTPFTPTQSITFEKEEITMDINDCKVLMPIQNPEDASIKKFKWNSSKPSIVSVADDGTITSFEQEGEAVITITSCDATSLSTSVTVKVCKGVGVSNIYGEKFSLGVENGRLHISGKKEAQIVEIYNTSGQLVESTTASVIELRAKGTFLVKIGSWTEKIMF